MPSSRAPGSDPRQGAPREPWYRRPRRITARGLVPSERAVAALLLVLAPVRLALQQTGRLPLLRDVLDHFNREQRTLRQGFAALGLSTGVGMGAGLVLGAMEGILAERRGLLLLVPAAIGMRGAIFGALGARLGTGILTGQYETTLRAGSFTGANVRAAVSLTFVSSALAAVFARATAAAFGVETISLWELMVVSMVGGIVASAFVLAGVLGLTATAQRRGLDMDAISSPLITVTGDLVTLPALALATLLLFDARVDAVLGVLLLASAVGAAVLGLRSPVPLTRRIVAESVPVLTYAALVDILAGTVLETRLEALVADPALLVLVPPFIATCGSLGGILAARLGSALHLGTIDPTLVPQRPAALDGSIIVAFALPAFTGVGLVAHVAARLTGLASPGLVQMVAIPLIGGLVATALLFAVGYGAATATYRFGLDPDNYGIPIVTATMDFLGILCLIGGITVIGAG